MRDDRIRSGRLCRREFLELLAYMGVLAGCGRISAPDAAPAVSDATLALVNGTLVDGTGADPMPGAGVAIQGERIVAVGDVAEEIPPGIQTLDVQGATILPGFINTHVHRSYDTATLQAWAQGGVTTVRDMGNGRSQRRLFAFRDDARDDPLCARLVAVGPIVTVPGGYPIAPWGGSGLTVTSPEDARKKVGRLLDNGADMIKFAMESGIIFGQDIPTLSMEEASAIVDVAREHGVRVSAHAAAWQDLEKVLDVGVDDVAHMVVNRLSDELIDRVVEADVYWVPTLELWRSVSEDNPVNFDAVAISNLQRFVAAGGKVALGTDYGGYTTRLGTGMPLLEIEMMQEAGMTPMQIIVAATGNAARVCGLGGEIGTLEVGKVADVLVVSGDPLADVHALADVRLVVRDGVVIRQ